MPTTTRPDGGIDAALGRSWLGLLVGGAIALSAGVASAQPAPTAGSNVAATNPLVSAASAYVDAGLRAQKRGDYGAAIACYWRAYALVPHPILLFDIAQAHRLAGRADSALTLYRRYLEDDPDGPKARTARELVAELEARAAVARSDPRAPPAPEPPRQDEPALAPGAAVGRDQTPRMPGPAAPAPPALDRTEAHDGAPPPRRADEAAVRLALGPSIAQRQLSFRSTAAGPSNSAFTVGALRVQGELYPFALVDRYGAAAGFGLTAAYDRPMMTTDTSIEYAHHELGMRYRIGLGPSAAIALGVDDVRRRYGEFLPPSEALAMPDVDYRLIAPSITGRLSLGALSSVFARLEALVARDWPGDVTAPGSYGHADLYGFGGSAGLDIALGRWFGLGIALEYGQVESRFDYLRATDRWFGAAVTLDVHY